MFLCAVSPEIETLQTCYRLVCTNIFEYVSNLFLTTEKLPPARKAICLFSGPNVGGTSRSERPTRFHVEESFVARSKAHRLHVSETPLKNASVVGTHVSAQGLSPEKLCFFWCVKEL